MPKSNQCVREAVRCCGENPAENVITPVLGTTFDSLGEAYDLCVHVGGYHPESTVKQVCRPCVPFEMMLCRTSASQQITASVWTPCARIRTGQHQSA